MLQRTCQGPLQRADIAPLLLLRPAVHAPVPGHLPSAPRHIRGLAVPHRAALQVSRRGLGMPFSLRLSAGACCVLLSLQILTLLCTV
jgi:hypothetical protein